MPLRSNKDGTYTVNWVPSVAGSYVLQIFIDSINTGESTTTLVGLLLKKKNQTSL